MSAEKSDDVEWTPVCAPRGTVVHAVTLVRPTHTACGLRMQRYRVHPREIVQCVDCKLAMGLNARPKKKRRRKVVR